MTVTDTIVLAFAAIGAATVAAVVICVGVWVIAAAPWRRADRRERCFVGGSSVRRD
jgi:hypothetical protein